MGQIVSSAAKPKRCNLNKLSQLGTPAAGEYILVSSDNSMNAAGQGNFDCYIKGNGTTAAAELPLYKIDPDVLKVLEQNGVNLFEESDISTDGTVGKYIQNSQGVGNECPMTTTNAAWMKYWKINAKAGERYSISGKDDSQLVWATVDSSGIITACAQDGLGTFENLIVTITEDCTLIINLHKDSSPRVLRYTCILNNLDSLTDKVYGQYINGKEIGTKTSQRLSTNGSIANDNWHSTYTITNNNYVAVECATRAWLRGEPQMAAINFYSSSTPSTSTLIKSVWCDSDTLKTFYSVVPENTAIICVDIRRSVSSGVDLSDTYIKIFTTLGLDSSYSICYNNGELQGVDNVGGALDTLVGNTLLRKDYAKEVASTATWSTGYLYSTRGLIVNENSSNTNWIKSDYINIQPYQSMRIILPYVDSGSTNNCIAFYDENYNVIFLCKLSEVDTSGGTYIKTLNIKGVSYVRLTARVKAKMFVFVFDEDKVNNGYKRVTVAASDGYGRNGIADYVCTGTNDELVIQKAVMDVFEGGSGEVVLLPGYYYIDGFANHNEDEDIYSAIQIPNKHLVYLPKVHIRGTSRYDCKLIVRGSGLDANKNYSIFDCEYPRASVTLKLSSFYVEFRTNQYKITAIDLSNCQLAEVSEISIISNITTYPVEGLIGVKGFKTAQHGGLQNLNNIICNRLHTAFDISGEHIVMNMCGALRCVYGFKFSMRKKGGGGTSDHPITLINCHDERNQNLPYFGGTGYSRKQTITFIDFNTEAEHGDTPWGCYQNYAKEEQKGYWRGIIYYSHAARSGVNVVDIPFWEHGYGLGFRTVNVVQSMMGTTAERNSYTPDYCQRFYDTTLNKELICIETKGRGIGAFEVTSSSVSAGNITLNVGDMTTTVALSANSGAENIAKDIYNKLISTSVSCNIVGSTLYIKSSSFMVIGDTDVSYTDSGSTGITFNCSVADTGTTGKWVDTMGNIV